MAKAKGVPTEIIAAFDAASRPACTGAWLRHLTDDQRTQFLSTCNLYIDRRAANTTSMTFGDFHSLVVEHFNYPFQGSSLRKYLAITWPEEFASQRRSW